MANQQILDNKKLLQEKCSELIQLLKDDEQSYRNLDDLHMQELFEILIGIYGQKVSTIDYDWQEKVQPIMPINKTISQTDASIFADKLLQAADIEIFELQIWRSMGASY